MSRAARWSSALLLSGCRMKCRRFEFPDTTGSLVAGLAFALLTSLSRGAGPATAEVLVDAVQQFLRLDRFR